MIILGIETSCDETSVGIVEDGKRILSNVVYSQVKKHKEFGGVVPEIASREHTARIDSVLDDAISEAGISLSEIDAVSVTQGPGLIGSLLVGFSFSKALSLSLRKPLIGVNHLFAHLYTPELENEEVLYPAIGLIVSGGHTSIYYVKGPLEYENLSKTRDDAAGEVMDKIAKHLGLGYPGGPLIDELSKKGDSGSYSFPFPKIKDGSKDYSFSGIKSYALRIIEKEGNKLSLYDFLASFQAAIIEYLLKNVVFFIKEKKPKSLIISGGVSRNSLLREKGKEVAEKFNLKYYLSSPLLCTDNGAMIAGIAYHYYLKGLFIDYESSAFSRFEPKGFR